MSDSFNITITGLSHDLAHSGIPETLESKGKMKARGRGHTWNYRGVTSEEADALTIALTDAAANINHISDSKNRAMEAHILRKDAEKVRNAIFEQRRESGYTEVVDLCHRLGSALEQAMEWMEGDIDPDGDGNDLWEGVLEPALIAYRKAKRTGVLR